MTHDVRRGIITRLLCSKPSVTVAELVEETGASAVTIRRDLDQLERQGVLRRRHGRAESLVLRGEDPGFGRRVLERTAVKQRMAAATARLLRDGESLILDSGTSCLELARTLGPLRATVMPLSLHSAVALTEAPNVELILPGGTVRRDEQAFSGTVAEATVRSLRVDTAVISPCGVDIDAGMTAYDLEDASIKRSAMASAARTILLCDGAKWGRLALARIGDLADVDVIVTEQGIGATEARHLEQLRQQGIDIIEVEAS